MNEDVFYHIYNRGNNREKIFFEEENYRYFLRRYKKYLLNYVDTYAYCLMPTHFHFCVRVKTEEITKKPKPFIISSAASLLPAPGKLTPIEQAFRDFFISYAKSINKRYDRTGSLFQYKFKRKPILNENYLMRLILYLHDNPLKAGLCKKYATWKFSSYNAILSKASSTIQRDEVLGLFGGRDSFVSLHQEYTNKKVFDEDDEDFNKLVDW